MSVIGLPLQWRLQAYNGAGADATVTGAYRGVKLSTDGALAYASTDAMTGLFTTTTVANAAYLASDTVDNSANLYLGAEIEVNVISTGGGDGSVTVYLQGARSTGNWPDDGQGEVAVVVSSTDWSAESTAGVAATVLV